MTLKEWTMFLALVAVCVGVVGIYKTLTDYSCTSMTAGELRETDK